MALFLPSTSLVNDLWGEIPQTFARMATRMMRDANWDLMDPTAGSSLPTLMQVKLDVVTKPDAYCITADLPGMTRNEVQVSLSEEDHVLTISGERKRSVKHQDETHVRMERAVGTFSRSISLPDDVEPSHVQATMQDGILTIQVKRIQKTVPPPKTPRTIPIQ